MEAFFCITQEIADIKGLKDGDKYGGMTIVIIKPLKKRMPGFKVTRFNNA